MQEDQEDAGWSHETNHEKEYREESALQCIIVGKLIVYQLLRHIPSQEQAGKECTQWHQQLSRKVVTAGQEVLAEE